MKKEDVTRLSTLLDGMFNGINENQRNKGTGLSFSYTMTPKIIAAIGKEPAKTHYEFSVILREAGHGERILQTIPFEKPKEMDRWSMEYQVMASIMTICLESTLLQWNEIGKMLNKDKKLQDIAAGKTPPDAIKEEPKKSSIILPK